MTYKRAFTLIELLVVISIIGILASIIMASLSTAKASGRDARRISDIKNIQLALSLYYNDNSKYPLVLSSLVPNYLAVLPTDPGNSALNYVYTAYSTGSVNCASSPAVSYHLGAVIENTGSSFMNQDVDNTSLMSSPYFLCLSSGSNFDGNSVGCSGTTHTATDYCYDVIAGM